MATTIVELRDTLVVFSGEQGPPGPPAGEEMPYAERTDFVGDDVIYRGWAAVGSSDAAPVWRIKRIDLAVDSDADTKWASGSADFIHAWDDRASYTYI